MPALEPSHALHIASQLDGRVLLCLSGRGDKDMATVLDHS
jgi:tryptophan synthase beta subunit